MRIPRIYYQGKLNSGENVVLPENASHYVVNVLRLKLSSELILFNGDGKEYWGEIVNISKKNVAIKIIKAQTGNNESPLHIHLLQGISKGDRMDFSLQKAVELGVNRITPILTEFCQVKLDETRLIKKNAHWQSIVISACQQSGRCVLPQLDFPQKFSNSILENKSDLKLICHPDSQPKNLRELQAPKFVAVLIGPEGGFSLQEVKQAEQSGFLSCALGPRILRTETAGLAAISLLQTLWGDFGC